MKLHSENTNWSVENQEAMHTLADSSNNMPLAREASLVGTKCHCKCNKRIVLVVQGGPCTNAINYLSVSTGNRL